MGLSYFVDTLVMVSYLVLPLIMPVILQILGLARALKLKTRWKGHETVIWDRSLMLGIMWTRRSHLGSGSQPVSGLARDLSLKVLAYLSGRK